MPWLSPNDFAGHYSQEDKVRLCDFVNKLVVLARTKKSNEELVEETRELLEELGEELGEIDNEMKAEMIENSRDIFMSYVRSI